jgi:hypothetical protein
MTDDQSPVDLDPIETGDVCDRGRSLNDVVGGIDEEEDEHRR